MDRTAIVLGATGMTGKQVVEQLLQDADFSKIKIIHRRQLDKVHEKLKQKVVEFHKLEKYTSEFTGTDIFCCLGTTMKKAGSKEEFRKVDEEYVLKSAEIAVNNGITNFYLISAMGADPKSMFFYNRIKGDVEENLKMIGFEKLGIFRPSMLAGKRQESRLGEQVGLKLMNILRFTFIGPLDKYAPIHAEEVAAGMIYFALHGRSGTHIFPSDKIKELAQKYISKQS